jgi:hypothetical protein
MKRFQFSSRHLLYVMTIVAVLIFPTQAFVKWFGRFRKTAASTVTVPDGGSIIIGGMVRRRDGTRVALRSKQSSFDKSGNPIPVKMMSVTPRIIIPEEMFPDIKR